MDPQHKTRRQFSKQFKAETVALIRSSGKSVPQVCRDLDLAESVVRRWLAQADIDDGRREGLTTKAASAQDSTGWRVRSELTAREAERKVGSYGHWSANASTLALLVGVPVVSVAKTTDMGMGAPARKSVSGEET